MNARLRSAGALVLAFALLLPALPAGAGGSTPGPDRLIVQLRDGRKPDVLATGVLDQRPVRLAGTHVLEVPAHRTDAVLAALSRRSDVVYAERDAQVRAVDVAPNDPAWGDQWGAQRIEAPAAWNVGTGHLQTTIAVLDTGVNPHVDLVGGLLAGFNALDGVADVTNVTDLNGHGTAVAGVVGARGNNASGIAGMCWSCAVLPVKVLDDEGWGSHSHIASGITWATDQGADVINLSLGGADSTTTLARAIDYAHQHGVVVVAAAGNAETTDRFYPAAYDTVIGVAASRSDDSRYSWSNYGAWVDVAAPGCTLTTLATGGYGALCGTSFSAPLVAGVAALAVSHTTATPTQVRHTLMQTAVPAAYVASGRVRAGAAMRTLAGNPTEPLPAPVPAPELEPAPAPRPGSEPGPAPLPEPEPAAACPAGGVPPAGFSDVTGATHAAAIDCVVWHGLSGGLGDGRYGPTRGVRRDQMAAFLTRTLQAVGVRLPDAPPVVFTDAIGNPHERPINQLAALGVVQGNGGGQYKPAATVRRDQMAAFLARAYAQAVGVPLPAHGARFEDTRGNVHREAIDALAAAGVVNGVGPDVYAPARTVRRDQMASFLARMLETLAAHGHPPSPQP